MSEEPNQPESKPDQPSSAEEPNPPDGRGDRPTDPNELAKWIVEQTTAVENGRSDVSATVG